MHARKGVSQVVRATADSEDNPDQVYATSGNPPPRMLSEIDLWNCYCRQSRIITETHASSTCYCKEGPFVS
jgi:hypothetical protein